ncbi:hypothetical protein [Bacillus haynesii]|uniref:hypothetical protein n=1 Tax=Bacillus haynesii TaxID=1925021 RepID=UPI0022823085|nr:hypothetical protein [Bacillus haynesii]MCY7850095.1 hypothetical protein [Bacillus haynesii]MCY7912162.1 hypothetical protein [Bacillus haynesii]MCY7925533.1 hypothetical protein [Bacillus haynesii]MCY8000887.1 hypothetical protein [Bacillus haynesii]MCY8002669.1 hypothetical protein [Bacillus haynesii]
MNKSEVLEIFEEVLEEWFSAELILLSQGGDGTADLEMKKELYGERFIQALEATLVSII